MCNKTVFLLPSQDLLFDESAYPVSQEHAYDPAVLSQTCSRTCMGCIIALIDI